LNALVDLRLCLLREIGNVKSDAGATKLAGAIRAYLTEKVPTGEFLAWVAEAEGQIVGAGGLIFLQKPPADGNLSGQEAHIMNMYITPQWRGKGIGTALINKIIESLKGTNAKRIRLHATESGRSVYEKVGLISMTSEMELTWG
jgi:GNAT superfamily N-acetyltransferase